jgi:anti-sigma factor (TIGR02949 family)
MAHSHDQDAPDCEAAIAEVYAYLDGEMTEERRLAIAHHLEGCSPCFEAFDFEAELRMVVQTHCRNDDVPESLRIRIVEELRVVTTGEDSDEADAAR